MEKAGVTVPDWTAEELLHHMRPEVEKILQKHKWTTPPSQTERSMKALNEWENPLGEDASLLLDFLAVRRTVRILNGEEL